MALKSSREGLRKELVDYLGNLIIDDTLRNELVKAIGDKFVTTEVLNENVSNLTIQITTESGVRAEADATLQNNINAESAARQESIVTLENLINKGVLKVDLLWTNASPTSYFAPQTISLDLSQYKCVLIDIILASTGWTVATNKRQTIYLVKEFDGPIAYGLYGEYFVYRNIKVNSDGIEISQGCYAISDGSNSEDNRTVIPFKIYGIK